MKIPTLAALGLLAITASAYRHHKESHKAGSHCSATNEGDIACNNLGCGIVICGYREDDDAYKWRATGTCYGYTCKAGLCTDEMTYCRVGRLSFRSLMERDLRDETEGETEE